ncbi:uncharacterized protein V6R79_020514 [Siganus canaliculatus]
MDDSSLSAGHRNTQAHVFSHAGAAAGRGASGSQRPRRCDVVSLCLCVSVNIWAISISSSLVNSLSLLGSSPHSPLNHWDWAVSQEDTMSNPIGNEAQCAKDERKLLCLKIKSQLEDLFCDSHLAEDGFLLKHVQRNKQGYVSLKLLTSLKKIRVLTTDWHMTLAGAEHSQVLELNEERTKVRRKQLLPEWLQYSPTTKALLVWNITEEETVENGAPQGAQHRSLTGSILQKFSVHGSIASVWIVHPGQELPKKLQCYGKRCKILGQHLCAVVTFDHLEAVREAFAVLKAEEEEKSNGEGMHVTPLGFQLRHHIPKDTPSEETHQEKHGKQQENPCKASEDWIQEKLPSPDVCKLQEHMQKNSINCGSGDWKRESSQSPWVLKRKSAVSALNQKVAGHLNAPYLVHRVLRQPFGPDGTKGFHGRRSRDATLFILRSKKQTIK